MEVLLIALGFCLLCAVFFAAVMVLDWFEELVESFISFVKGEERCSKWDSL